MGDVVPFPRSRRQGVPPIEPAMLQRIAGGHAIDLVPQPWPTQRPHDTPMVAWIRRRQLGLKLAMVAVAVFAASWFAAAAIMGAGQW